jgi:cytochrome c553
MRLLVLFVGAVLVMTGLMASPAAAGDVAAGEAKVGPCVTCHGRDGIGTAPQFPNLAGQSAIYMIQQLQAFRDGGRQSEMMSLVAQSLSDQDIEDLAAYYESLGPDCAGE